MNRRVPGLHKVFALGLLPSVEPSYYAKTNGSIYGSALKQFSFLGNYLLLETDTLDLLLLVLKREMKYLRFVLGWFLFFLRKLEDEKYKIVGEFYVHGIMRGEALR